MALSFAFIAFIKTRPENISTKQLLSGAVFVVKTIYLIIIQKI